MGLLVGLDRDREILEVARSRLATLPAHLHQGSFEDLESVREELPVSCFDGVLLDLGVSSLQLDDPERGFSFRRDGPLDMRMDPSVGPSARELLRDASVEDLTRWIREFGEERHAGRVARSIVSARGRSEITTTGELAAIVRKAVRSSGKIDPATRTFQAIRIVVNREMEALDRFLSRFDPWLAPGGRLAILSYHSLEDRRVKNAFRERVSEGDHELLTPQAVRPSTEEVNSNPRARSARLRAVRRLRREDP